MSLLNPWVLLGIVMAVLSAFGGGYYKGKDSEYQRQQLEIAALNAKARETEQAMAKVAQTYGETLRKANNVAKAKENQLRADLNSGALKLRIPTKATTCPSVPVPETATVASGSDSGEARAESSGSVDVAADLLQIAADGDAAIRKLNTCLEAYETLRNTK
jgi:cobalamin biosynthesis Mg chelatase CobN